MTVLNSVPCSYGCKISIYLERALREGKGNVNQGHLQDWNERQVMPFTGQLTLGAFVSFFKPVFPS